MGYESSTLHLLHVGAVRGLLHCFFAKLHGKLAKASI